MSETHLAGAAERQRVKRQAVRLSIFRIVQVFATEHERWPTVREVQARGVMLSKTTVHNHLAALAKAKGLPPRTDTHHDGMKAWWGTRKPTPEEAEPVDVAISHWSM